MPYPHEEPTSKHDLVGPRSLIKSADQDILAAECRFSSTVELFEALDRGQDPQSLRLLVPVYSYPDAPTVPLSRALVMIGVADTSLSAVRKLICEDTLPSCLAKCTVAVKRADPEYASRLEEKDIINSHSFAKLMRLLRSEGTVAVLGTDKEARFGLLRPIDVHQRQDSSYSVDEFAAEVYVGNVNEVKQFLTGPVAEAPMIESAPAAETDTSNGDLWQPPGSNDADENGAGLWQPPGAESSGGGMDFGGGGSSESAAFDAWHPSSDRDKLSGNKRKLSEEFHADSGAAAADKFYSGLTRSLDTRADSWLYHMRSFNGWVKATQIQELDPKTNVKGKRAPLRVLDLACGKGGDLGKWNLHNRGVSNYVGVDVARGSLRDAALRVRKMKKLNRCTFTCADLGSDVPGRLRSPKHTRMQKLLSWSLQNEPKHETSDPEFKLVRGGGIFLEDKFDVVSIQFAIHYMMSSRTRARRFFQTVSELLEVGGNLIVTTIDARVVLDHLQGLGIDLHFHDDDGNSSQQSEGALIQVGGGACRIMFEGDVVRKLFATRATGADSEDLFGLQYTFTLVEGSDHAAGVGDAVNLPEWLTPLPVLESLAEEAGLVLESAENFHEFFANRRDPIVYPMAHAALYNMKVLDRNGSMSRDEWEISRLYVALKFRKIRESSMNFEDNAANEEDSGESENEVEQEETSLAPEVKAKWMPLALPKAKKAIGVDAWATLSSDEKKLLIEKEIRKLAT